MSQIDTSLLEKLITEGLSSSKISEILNLNIPKVLYYTKTRLPELYEVLLKHSERGRPKVENPKTYAPKGYNTVFTPELRKKLSDSKKEFWKTERGEEIKKQRLQEHVRYIRKCYAQQQLGKTNVTNDEIREVYSKHGKEMTSRNEFSEKIRQRKPFVWDNVHFMSNQELQVAQQILTNPIEGVNYNIRIGIYYIDFFPQQYDKQLQGCFVEYHPWDLHKRTAQQYYYDRQQIIQNSDYKGTPLILITKIQGSDLTIFDNIGGTVNGKTRV